MPRLRERLAQLNKPFNSFPASTGHDSCRPAVRIVDIDHFVALNPETGTTTQGETVEEAVANLKEATALYLSEFPLPSLGHPVVTMFTVPEPIHA